MNLLEMNIDKTVPVPLYYQLKSLILSEIKKGNLKEGDCLPTEMQMVEHFHVSRSTVRQAISDLSKEGWLERIASKGTFVTNNTSHSENFIRSFEPFYQQVSRQNKTPSTELLNLQVVPANETLAKKLGIEPGEKLISMFRRRLSDTENQRKKVYKLTQELGWEKPARVNGLCMKMFKVSSVEWLNYQQCSKLIEALKSMAARKEKQDEGLQADNNSQG